MDPQELLAPMVATVVRVEVEPGDAVRAGQAVVVLECIKRYHRTRVTIIGDECTWSGRRPPAWSPR